MTRASTDMAVSEAAKRAERTRGRTPAGHPEVTA
jgi:hypothetical protein